VPVNFPVSLDDFTDPNPAATLAAEGHAARHKDITDAIEAIEAVVGITGSADPLSHDARLESVEVITAALGTAANADSTDFDPAGAADAVRLEILSRVSMRC
jgi:hypothetical protein